MIKPAQDVVEVLGSLAEQAGADLITKLVSLTEQLGEGVVSQADFNSQATDSILVLERMAQAQDKANNPELAAQYRQIAAELKGMVVVGAEAVDVMGSLAEQAGADLITRLVGLAEQLSEGAVSQADFNSQATDNILILERMAQAQDEANNPELAAQYRQIATELKGMVVIGAEAVDVMGSLAEQAGADLITKLVSLTQQLEIGATSQEDFNSQALENITVLERMAQAQDKAGNPALAAQYRQVASELKGMVVVAAQAVDVLGSLAEQAGADLVTRLVGLTEQLSIGTLTQQDFNTQALDNIVVLGRMADAQEKAHNPELAAQYRQIATELKGMIVVGAEAVDVMGNLAEQVGADLVTKLVGLTQQLDMGTLAQTDFNTQALENITILERMAQVQDRAGNPELAAQYRQIAAELKGMVVIGAEAVDVMGSLAEQVGAELVTRLVGLTQQLEIGPTTQEDFNNQALDNIVVLERMAQAQDKANNPELAAQYRQIAAELKNMVVIGEQAVDVIGNLAEQAGADLVTKLVGLTQQLDIGTVTQEDFNTQALENITVLERLAQAQDRAGNPELAAQYREMAAELKGMIKPGMDVGDVLGTLAD
ncbi:hypothetical protein [Deinococcus alpinitundrae]|uniref:hypothetical protein n=1 Tax=Deinococcus alpinitundrae TaxID=468913 RepID=UPI00137A9510|nr:hypothetical protein [Deinococcus alpinitundrae]